jgi:hypothetical protein
VDETRTIGVLVVLAQLRAADDRGPDDAHHRRGRREPAVVGWRGS